jgi:hypothetical protein
MLKEKLVVLLSEAFHMVRFQNNELKKEAAGTMGDLIKNQKSFIVSQKQVLAMK